ncbi:type II toxin-antitoxin system HicB family antitoxin [Acinetobacter gerneri]|uniref:type II toxin-antitoxin system HicB family antitoxin n=1 Tax=Acinetobacter gerneri TaxID=202952 RepID=UPI0028ABA97F|nr:type II toxin-antitoxin system HicB family antitoxin [Acinetobacter gerneri]
MKETLRYKGFYGSMEFSLEDECLVGEVLFVQSKIIFIGDTVPELKQAFEDAVDAYLDHCKDKGIEPEKSMSGSFNIRISPDQHKQLALKALELDYSINACVVVAMEQFLNSQNSIEQSINQVSETLVSICTQMDNLVTVDHLNSYNSFTDTNTYELSTSRIQTKLKVVS